MKLKRKFGLILYAIPIIILVVILSLELSFMKKQNKVDGLCYKEKSDISYKVLLKPNNYYEKDYLDNKYTFVASLIDKFIVDYSYINTFSTDVDYKLKYNVKAELVVYDSNSDEKPIYTKSYTLINEDEIKGKGIMAKLDLNEKSINYDEYTAIVNQLRKEVIPNANLIVKFNTNFEGKSDLVDDKIVSSKTTTITIPVSQRTINVDVKKNVNDKEECLKASVTANKQLLILMIATIILLVLCIIKYIIYIIKTAKKRSKYEQEVNRILREFDRAITEAKGKLRIDDSDNTIEVKDFMELLDCHDNFNIPILYYKISKYMCVFVVKYNNDIYYNVMKSDDYN